MKKNVIGSLIAGVFFTLGTIGIALPLIPTVPFWILAAIIYLKTDPELAKKIFSNKTYGKIVEDFVVKGIITRKSKIFAFFGLFIIGGISLFFTYKIKWLFIIQILALSYGAYFVISRKELEQNTQENEEI